MTFKQLEHFLAVAKLLSFSAASKQLFISQPALSRSISALEDELGVSLLLRDTHSVRLTPAGIVFAAAIPRLQSDLQLTIEDVRQANDGVRGSLKLGIIDGVYPAPEFTGVIDYFRRSLPYIDTAITCLSENELVLARENQTMDLYYTFFPSGHIPPSISTVIVREERVCIASSIADYPNFSEQMRLSALRDETFLFCCRESALHVHHWREFCSAHGFMPKISFVENHSTLQFLIEQGHGIAALPESDRCFESPAIRLTETDKEFSLSAVVAWNPDNHNPSANLFSRLLSGDISSA